MERGMINVAARLKQHEEGGEAENNAAYYIMGK
jgi:hypothetical protein